MVKHICDKCLEEVSELHLISTTTAAVDIHGAVVASWDRTICELCSSCNEKLEKLDITIAEFMTLPMKDIDLLYNSFKVGDEVITDDGRVGVIESICTCKSCRNRGFYEPSVKNKIEGSDQIYITDTDKRNGFISFYKIGNRVYGNIDKDALSRRLDSINKEIQRLSKEKKTLREQITVLNELKQDQDDQDGFDWLM